MKFLYYHLKLLCCLFNCNCYCNGCTYHRVVTHTDKSHHFNMSRNRRWTCKLCISVHSSHGIRHTVRSRTCCHVIRMQCSSGTAARSYWEILFTVFNCPFFICSCNRMLESCRVCRISCNWNIYSFVYHHQHRSI